jgi:hypothetical protein
MPRYYIQLHQQLGHEMKPFRFRLPPLHRSPLSLAIPSQSCALFNTAQAQKCCQTSSPSCHARPVLAIITALKVLQIPIVSCYINLARPSRSRRNSGRIPFRARRLISVHRIPRPRHRIIYYLMILQPTSQRQSSKRFGSLSQHSHLQRETVVKFGGRNGHCP